MTRWYTLKTTGDDSVLTFQPSTDRYWPTTVLRDDPLPALDSRRVVLTGSGAVWMYAHAAARAAATGAEVSVRLQGRPGTSRDLRDACCTLTRAGNPSRALLLVDLPREPRLADEAVGRLLRPRLAEFADPPPEELCLTGRSSGLTYALAAAAGVRCKVPWLTCLTPVDGLVVIHTPEPRRLGDRLAPPDWLGRVLPPPDAPVLLGVTGDPTLGKSVFSTALDHLRSRRHQRGWRLDCDGQAPTPPWYLSLLSDPTHAEEARQARDGHKRPWTDEMEAHIADQLNRLRQYLDVVIADLPGGNHKARPPQRLPPGRERFFRQIDALVLLDRPDGSTEAAWRQELRRHGLERSLAAVLRSGHPTLPPALTLDDDQGGVLRGRVQGLDRSHATDGLVKAFGEDLSRLYDTLVRRARAARPPA